jgi:hypothetical protein
MPTQTHELRANRSADSRRHRAHSRLREAQLEDAKHDNPHDKRQWNALVQYMLSESKNLDRDGRRQMFAHMWECVEQMNQASRVVRPD